MAIGIITGSGFYDFQGISAQKENSIENKFGRVDYIEGKIKDVSTSKIDLKQALIIAIDIEKSLLESGFFRVFNLSGPKAAKIRSRLVEATKAHKDSLIKWQADIGKNNKPV